MHSTRRRVDSPTVWVRRTAVLVGLAVIATACAEVSTSDCSPPLDPSRSVARMWNEATLDAIRRDEPSPPVHARNLFHVSVAMWDAWAAYDERATGHIAQEHATATDTEAARQAAISYAAYRVLVARFSDAEGSAESRAAFDALLESLCLSPTATNRIGSAPAAVGNRIAVAVLEAGATDGADNAIDDYRSPNVPLAVTTSGTRITQPNVWQPLFVRAAFDDSSDAVAQAFLTPHWGEITPFSLTSVHELDPGTPPHLGDPASEAAFKEAIVEVILLSGTLDPASTNTIDAGPASRGDNPLGGYGGPGHPINPVTGAPYAPNPTPEADFGRAIAEFWGDGPDDETPPGHWNVIANWVSDDPRLEHRIGGEGPEVDRLEWDVKMYLALNGALHDAAIAAWWTKRYYDYVRPISMVRHLGGLGQSSDPGLPSFHPDGLPLVPGSIEVVTTESSAPGARHDHLADRLGAVAIRAWLDPRGNNADEPAGVGWILAADWMPYQEFDFVTPPFPGYVSGHSTFSRAAAEVLSAITGSPYFPGGMGEWTVPAGSLEFDFGPSQDVTLQWATYADAADESGLSRLYGGIHVRADDLGGRFVGSICGRTAWDLARGYWEA